MVSAEIGALVIAAHLIAPLVLLVWLVLRGPPTSKLGWMLDVLCVGTFVLYMAAAGAGWHLIGVPLRWGAGARVGAGRGRVLAAGAAAALGTRGGLARPDLGCLLVPGVRVLRRLRSRDPRLP